jgi:hypothetical protein
VTECQICELEHSADVAKSMLSVPELADMLGLEPVNGKIHSPWNPDERTPSCHLYDDHFWDFSTGQGGDVIDLLRAFNPEMSYGRAVSRLCHKAVKAGREPGDVERLPVRQLVDFTERLAGPHFRAVNAYSQWTDALGLPLPANVVPLVDQLLIPHEDENGVYGVKVRGADGSKSAWPGSQFSHRLYDPLGWIGGSTHGITDCVIAEGESDCWAVRPHVSPLPVYALPSGAGTWKDHWLKDLEPFDAIWICMDNDRAGTQARDKITSKVGYLRARQLRVPPLYNDAREAIAAGWRPNLTVVG